jgi:hypothetical protein
MKGLKGGAWAYEEEYWGYGNKNACCVKGKMQSYQNYIIQTAATVTVNYCYGGYDYAATATAANYLYQQGTGGIIAQGMINGMTSLDIETVNAATWGGQQQLFETKRERVMRKLQTRKWNREEKARRQRATEILVAVLDDKQRQQFETHKSFELQVNSRLYRIRPGSRVERLDPMTKKVLSYFCIHPKTEYNLPSEDVALTQKLLLETDESEFLRVANETKAA